MSDPTVRRVLVTGSILFHAAALAGLAVAAMWHIEKLPLDNHGGVVAAFDLPRDTGGGAAPAKTNLVPATVKKVVPQETVQPTIVKETKPATSSTTAPVGDSKDGLPGNGTGGDGKGHDKPTATIGQCAVPPCDTTTKEVPKPPVVEKKVTAPALITPADAAALRISGNDHIDAPNDVKVTMVHEGKSRLTGAVKLCIDEQGAVSRATLLKSTGYDEYDQEIVGDMSAWRYRPYQKDGVASAACTVVTLIFVMH